MGVFQLLLRVAALEGPAIRPSGCQGPCIGRRAPRDATRRAAPSRLPRSVNCASCSKPLLPRPRRRLGGLGGRAAAAAPEPSDYLVCDGCRRCFHERCCERGGVPTEAAADGTWYHDPDCKRAAAALRAQADRGPVQLPCGRAWQLVPLARGLAGARDRAAGGGGGAVAARKQQLQALVEVLAPEYVSGPWRVLHGCDGWRGVGRAGADEAYPLWPATPAASANSPSSRRLWGAPQGLRGRGPAAGYALPLACCAWQMPTRAFPPALPFALARPQGPGVADQLLESNGYALLLTSGGAPVTAATLDVYGTVRGRALRGQGAAGQGADVLRADARAASRATYEHRLTCPPPTRAHVDACYYSCGVR